MDRKFIKENCKKCWSGLYVFGLWCHESKTEENDMRMRMCSEVPECPYKLKNPTLFEKGYHLRTNTRKKVTHDSTEDE